MFELERLLKKWIVEQIDLADRQIVRCPPVRVDQVQFVVRQSLLLNRIMGGIRELAATHGTILEPLSYEIAGSCDLPR